MFSISATLCTTIIGSVAAVLFSTLSLAQDRVIFLSTEHYPPYNISNDDVPNATEKVSGYSTEIVRAMFKQAGYTKWDEKKCDTFSDGNSEGLKAAAKGEGLRYCIRVYPWKRGLDLTQNKANHALFSTIKTSKRAPLFSWVGPIAELNWVLMSKKGAKIEIEPIDDIKKYRVGGYQGDAIVQHLTQVQGIGVDQVRIDVLNLEMLKRGRIDLWATSNLYGPYFANKNNYPEPESAFVLKVRRMHIAFHKDTPKKLLKNLETALSTIRNNGTVASINKLYGISETSY